jgi:hypothetical protein
MWGEGVSALEALRELKCFCTGKGWDCGRSRRKKSEEVSTRREG